MQFRMLHFALHLHCAFADVVYWSLSLLKSLLVNCSMCAVNRHELDACSLWIEAMGKRALWVSCTLSKYLLSVMPDHILQFNPFVAKSFLKPRRGNEEIEEEELHPLDTAQPGPKNEVDGVFSREWQQWSFQQRHWWNNTVMGRSVLLNYRRVFIIRDGPLLAQEVFVAMKNFRRESEGVPFKVTATSIRDDGNNEFWKVLRFMFAVPDAIDNELNTCLDVPKSSIPLSRTLFARSTCSAMLPCDIYIYFFCTALAIEQRWADWLLLLQFRMTEIIACQMKSFAQVWVYLLHSTPLNLH